MYGVSKRLHSASLSYCYVCVSYALSNPTAIQFVSLSGQRVWYIGRVGCPDGGNDVIDERSFLAKPTCALRPSKSHLLTYQGRICSDQSKP